MFDDEENAPEKISLDELYESKQKRDLRILNTFKIILARVHKLIKLTSRQKIDQQFCWFTIPEFIFGVPSYNNHDCAVYIIEKLQDNGFQIKYTHPNLLLISWQHWVPNYVRQELKKKTGMEIDGNGKFIKKNGENQDLSSTPFSMNNRQQLGTGQTIPQFMGNSNNNHVLESNVNEREFKDVRSYNPTGGLVYKEQLLQDLHNKLKLK